MHGGQGHAPNSTKQTKHASAIAPNKHAPSQQGNQHFAPWQKQRTLEGDVGSQAWSPAKILNYMKELNSLEKRGSTGAFFAAWGQGHFFGLCVARTSSKKGT